MILNGLGVTLEISALTSRTLRHTCSASDSAWCFQPEAELFGHCGVFCVSWTAYPAWSCCSS